MNENLYFTQQEDISKRKQLKELFNQWLKQISTCDDIQFPDDGKDYPATEYFVKDESDQPIIPLDWKDVRVLKTGTDDKLDDEILTPRIPSWIKKQMSENKERTRTEKILNSY